MAAGKSLLAKLGLDTTSFVTGFKQALGTAKSGTDSINVEFIRMSKTLASSFDAGQKSAKSAFDQMKAAAAQLALEGKKGSAEWDHHVKNLKAAEKEAQRFEDAMEAVGAAIGQTAKQSKSFGEVALGAFAVTEVVDQAAQAFNQLTAPAKELDTMTGQLRTLGTEAAEMSESLRSAALDMSKNLPFAAADIQGVMFDALASGVKGGEEGLKTFADTAAKLAVGGGAEIGKATTLLAGQMNAYGASSDQATKYADTFFNIVNFGVTSVDALANTLANVVPTAAAAGVNIDNVGAALALMTQKGVPTAQSTTKLNQLLIELQKPAANLAPILEAAGVSLESLRQDDLPTTLGKVKDAIDATGGAAIQFFGSSEAAAAFSVLTGDLQGFEQTLVDVATTSGSAENAFNEMAKTSAVQTDIMKSKMDAFLISISDMVGPKAQALAGFAAEFGPVATSLGALSTLAVNVGGNIGKMSAKFSELGGFSGIISKLGSSLADFGKKSVEFGKAGLKTMFSWKGAALGAAAGIAAVILGTEEGQAAMEELTASLGKAIAPVLDAIMPLVTGIIDAITPIMDAIGGVLGDIIGSITGALSGVIGGMAKVFTDLFAIIGPLLNQVLGVITPIIEAVGGSLFAAFNNVGEAISGALGSVVEIFSSVFASLQPIITSLTETLTPIFQQLGETIGGVFQTIGLTLAGLVQSFVPIIQQLATTLGPIIQQLADTFGMLFSVVAEVFGSILQTVVPIVGELVGTIGTLLGDLLNQVLPLLLPLVETIAELFATGLSQIATVLKDVFSQIAPIIQQVAQTIGPIIGTIATVITNVLGNVLPIITGILQQLIGIIGPILETVGGLLSTLAGTIGTVLGEMFETLGPVIEQLAGVLGQILSTLGEVLGNLLSSMKPVIDGLLAVLSTLLPIIGQLVTTLVEALAPIITTIVGVFGQMLQIVGDLVAQIVSALQPVLLTLGDLFGQIFSVVGEVFQQLAGSLKPILEEMSVVFGELVAAVGTTVGELAQALVPVIQLVADLVAQLVKWLAGKLQVAFEALAPIIAEVAGAVARVLGKALQFLVGLLTKVMKVLTPIITAIGKWLSGAIRDVVEWIRGALASALNWLTGALDWIRGAFNSVTGAIGSVIGWIGGFIAKLREASPIINFFGNLVDKIVGFLGDLVGWVKDAVVEFLKFLGILDDAPQKVTIDVEVNQSGTVTTGFEDNAPGPDEIPTPDTPTPTPRNTTPEGDKNSDDPFEKRLGELAEQKETEIANAKATIKNEQQLQLELLKIDRSFAKQRLDVAEEFNKKGHEEAKKSLNDFKDESIEAGKAFDAARGDLLRTFQEGVAKDGEKFLDQQQEFVEFLKEISADLTTEEATIAGALTQIEEVRKRLADSDSPLLPEEAELKKALDKIPEELLKNPKLQKARDELGKAFAEIDTQTAERLARVEKERSEGIISEKEAADARVLITRSASLQQTEAIEGFYENVAKLRAEDAKAEVEAEKARFKITKTFLDAAKSLVDAFYAYKDEARNGDLQKELDTLKKEEDDLAISLAKRTTSFADYDKRLGEIAEKRAELNAELNQGAIPLDKRIKDALTVAAQSFATQQSDALASAIDERNTLLEQKEDYIQTRVIELGKAGMDAKAALLKAETEAEETFGAQVVAAREKMYAQVVTTAVANFAALRKDGGNMLVDLGIAALDALIPVVTGALSSALIQAFAFLGPIGGALAAGTITALAAVALASLRGALAEMEAKKAATGVVDIAGPGTDTSDNLHFMLSPGESVVTAKGTRAKGNKQLLGWMNKTGKSWMEFARMELPNLADWTPPQLELSDIVVTPAGEAPDLLPLIRATQEQTERLESKMDDQYRLAKWEQKERRRFRKSALAKAGASDGKQMSLYDLFDMANS